jgi:osmotically-inducible protein OsmY
MNQINFYDEFNDKPQGFYFENEVYNLDSNSSSKGRKKDSSEEQKKNRIEDEDIGFGLKSFPKKNTFAKDHQLIEDIHDVIDQEYFLSDVARNIHVIAYKGRVTLRGSVYSEEEKTLVSNKAEAIAGAGKVNNLLEVIEEME